MSDEKIIEVMARAIASRPVGADMWSDCAGNALHALRDAGYEVVEVRHEVACRLNYDVTCKCGSDECDADEWNKEPSMLSTSTQEGGEG